MSATFAELGVPESILHALARRGITKPFDIQAATVADALAGRDVCGRAPTGSGKTLAFGIPLVANARRAEPKRPRALVLAPTRELAEQIATEMRTFAGPVRIAVVYGGVGYGNQIKELRRGVEILVACPGRLEDLIQQGAVSLAAVHRIVLDEADRMADMGFMPAVRRLLDQTAEKRQTMLFSATLDGDVAKLTRDYQHDALRHEVGEETPDITAASHVFWNVEKADRPAVAAEAVSAMWPAIVFCRTRHGADRLAKQLDKAGIHAATIHGGRSQNQRTRALADFAKGKAHALVASDVAARGIHVDGVAAVIHYDAPEDPKTYVHRSGRTARAGKGGVVVTLVMPDQVQEMRKTQRVVGLQEPFTAPNPSALRSLSPSVFRSPAQPNPAAQNGANGSGAAAPRTERPEPHTQTSANPRGAGAQAQTPDGPKRRSRVRSRRRGNQSSQAGRPGGTGSPSTATGAPQASRDAHRQHRRPSTAR